MDEQESPAAEAPQKSVDDWARAKGVAPFFLEGAVGRERAAGRWSLHERPVVNESDFDAAVAAFSGLRLG